MLSVQETDGGEILDTKNSRAWALVDHQFSHVFVKDADESTIQNVRELFADMEGVAEVLVGDERAKYGMDHERSGEVILISTSNSWQAYYYWLDDANAPDFARTVDIHRKPGYDPVELFFDPASKGIPLDATLVKGSHGAPVESSESEAVLLASDPILTDELVRDVDVSRIVENLFHTD